MPLTNEHVRDALRTVKDPDLHKDLVTLNMVKDVRVDGEDVTIHIELTTPAQGRNRRHCRRVGLREVDFRQGAHGA